MNIKRAKQEIKDTIESYLLKDEYGDYVIPQIRQRPVLLLGAPGIGKTQIMEQIAKECGIGLVAYTITHHTRQSAIGLPFISRHQYGGQEYAVTEYTMSEIVASIYNKMEKTGLKEGILFIDEINCVSETLAPAMLQFLQCKMFGNHEIPQGWIIVAAGNPPEYNKSVREFDVVTMDRVKKIEVEPDFNVWKEYAMNQQLHPAVISYLNTRTANFYRMETTVDGRKFATPRGWEDLSQILEVYEKLGKTMDREVVVQYIQHEKIAKDFANYLELYYKYQMDYQLDAVLNGTIDELLLKKAAHASFDEKLSVVSLLLSRLRGSFAKLIRQGEVLELVFASLCRMKAGLLDVQGGAAMAVFAEELDRVQREHEAKRAAELLTRREDRVYRDALRRLEEYQHRLLSGKNLLNAEREAVNGRALHLSAEGTNDQAFGQSAAGTDGQIFEQLRIWFNEAQDQLDEEETVTGGMLEHAFDFLEAAYGPGQEMVIFITELNSDSGSIQFLKQYECERYYRYNRQLLFEESGRAIEERLRQYENR